MMAAAPHFFLGCHRHLLDVVHVEAPRARARRAVNGTVAPALAASTPSEPCDDGAAVRGNAARRLDDHGDHARAFAYDRVEVVPLYRLDPAATGLVVEGAIAASAAPLAPEDPEAELFLSVPERV